MKQTKRLNVIVAALMAISHNRINYPAGSVFEVSAQDVTFLRMSGAVREPTSDELKVYEERQTLATVTATAPDNTEHAGLQPQPPSDSEPDTSVINAPKPPTTEAHHITPPVNEVQTIGLPVEPEAVIEAPQPEPVAAIETVKAVEPEIIEAVEVAESVKNPYGGWLKKDLNVELDGREIEHDATARNDDLEALLLADDAKQVQAAE